jgi:hypothetical protein
MPRKPKEKSVEKFEEKYYIVSKGNIMELSRRVRQMIAAGARPIGGMTSDFGPEGKIYAQTMIFD